ncbi:NifU family protein [Thermoanaerobacter siderophilus]|uniref:Thioredoxin-like protein n=1 Tax=Thermoanaerobacter siderophilus SR4 TaxID=880478 RepID=I9KU86_9THEO|nr:NifU family protein [Thermoanaerobacter siderophilus]EIW00534.1 thioredoxin-like protein [Thermoanaerobacter siderophilus SR4]
MDQDIKSVLDNLIRPMLRVHGGDIEIIENIDGNIRLRLMGQCCTCPIAYETTENFIKTILFNKLDGIKKVTIESGLSNEMVDLAKRYLRGGKVDELA